MKMRKQFCVTLASFLAFFYACEKEPVTPDNTFPVRYYFYNVGDTSLKKAVCYCSTFYPKEKLTSWISYGKWRDVYFYDSIYFLHDFDSIIIKTDVNAYPGCIYVYDVSLHFTDSTGTGHIKKYSKCDTIHSQDDETIKFYWPKDSLSFTRIH